MHQVMKKMAAIVVSATRLLEAVNPRAPLEVGNIVDDDAAAVPEPEDVVPLDIIVAVTSIGMAKGVLALLRLTVPSGLMTDGLAARNVRVYITFSMTYCHDQSGMLDKSMVLPHAAASELFAVIICVYDHIADITELLATIEGIMLATVMLLDMSALGGLRMPNIPFSQ